MKYSECKHPKLEVTALIQRSYFALGLNMFTISFEIGRCEHCGREIYKHEIGCDYPPLHVKGI